MAQVQEAGSSSQTSLADLIERLERQPGFLDVVRSLQSGNSGTLDGVWGSSRALVVAALAENCGATVVAVCSQQSAADDLCDDLPLFTSERPVRFPAWDCLPEERSLEDEVYGDRLRLLKRLDSQEPPRVVVTTIQSLLQPVPDCESLDGQTRRLQVGDEIDLEATTRWLAENGFHATGAVAAAGEFSLRGGILDIFAPDWEDPVRVELFGDEIESIRKFDVATQRSLLPLDRVDITLLDTGPTDTEHLASHLPEGSWFLLIEPRELQDEGVHFLNLHESREQLHSLPDVLKAMYRWPSVTAESIAAGSLEATCHLQIESVERFSGDIGRVRDELDAAGAGQQVFLVCETEAEAQRLEEVFRETRLAREDRLHFPIGRLKSGFRLVPDRLALVSGAELFHRQDLTRRSRRQLGRAIDSFLELRKGDLVVHLAHGVGRFRGMQVLQGENSAEEHLEIEFHGGTKIYVPSSKIELVQKYVGGAKAKPSLGKIGGRTWARQKAAAEAAVTDLAVEMLEMQASRAARPGIVFPPDTAWQQEFDASFPYQETPDQLGSIEAIKSDMRKPRPMDRLLCGDVGFGKTELAIRAAFKAVDAGYQVAVLVPTTVLCEQHLRTFRSRMAEFPFEIEGISRFCSLREERRIVQGLAEGTIDIVVGTHRLAQEDIRFHNLGLVIIDEEQRFGVAIKERLKSLRQTVDVLTMTATPIPRTLHMSLLGVRDISNLETPPADRQAVETHVTRFDAETIRHAVLRELNRGGQIFFVHNRVQDIENVRARLQEIVPEARIDVGHGQMPGRQLEDVMLRFVDGQFDLLLATTIVESGLDIPNANTMFIDEADNYGLADLHQLRGRVGRYRNRAYCYLLLNPGKHVSPEASRRLRAIEEFSDMGSGFAIAMRDLEIRGAGNLLGTQQSGHIAAVGYELYCSLLENAVRKQLDMPPKESVDVNIDLPCEAFLPRNYVPDMRVKIDLYRRLARITSTDPLAEFASELVDRFGTRPPEVDRLLALARLRILAHRWKIRSIHLEDSYAVLGYSDRARIERLRGKIKGRLRIVDDRSAYLPLPPEETAADRVVSRLKSVLQDDGQPL